MKGWMKCLALLVGLTLHVAAFAQSTKYVPMVPARLMDTRPGSSTVDGQFAGSGPLASWTTTPLTVTGRAGIPSSGVDAVALNITVTDPAGSGYLTAWPAGTTLPNASNLNFVAGLAVSNQVIAKVGTNGQVSIFTYAGGGTANVIVDVAGYFPTNSDLTSLTPARLLDTRSGMTTIDGQFAGGGAVAAGATLGLTVLGRGGVPASGVSAVVVNVTATGATASTFITAWPSGAIRPNASNLNVFVGQTVPNLVMVAPGPDGKISLYNNVGSTNLIVDVVGYFSSIPTFAPLVPARLLDTRPGQSTVDGQFVGQGAIGSGGTLDLTVLGRGGVPSVGVGAVALNVTAVVPTAAGYLTAWGTGTTSGNAPPQAMDINFTAGSVVPSLVIVQVPANGKVSLYNSNGSTHVIADVVGWFPSTTTYLGNGSFETPALSAGTYLFTPSGASWVFNSGAGISTSSSAFTNGSPEIPLGNQVAFLQNTGCISQTPYLTSNPVLTFNATQRIGYNTQPQSIAVYVNNVPQQFTVGSLNGAYAASSITPPSDYYASYGVLLAIPSNGYYNIKICGLVNSGDSTAFVDTVAISTPANRAFGLWDNNGTIGAWRSDYATSTTPANIDPDPVCKFPDSSNYQFGGLGGPYCKKPISWPNFNWFSSNSTVAGPPLSPYIVGSPYWQVIVNVEDYNLASCTSGPPAQSIPLQPRGAANGARFDILNNTSLAYPSLGPNMIYQLVYTPGDISGPCKPYIGLSASSSHGNGKHVAVMDQAGNYRPRLRFKESVFQATGFVQAYVVITISGFDDNVRRALFLVLGEQHNGGALDLAQGFWNWPIKNSKYYPGYRSAVVDASIVQGRCGFSAADMPVLSFTNQWIPSGQSPSAISTYNFDLYKLVSCIAHEVVTQGPNATAVSGWAGANNQLPDPIVIDSVEWAVETTTFQVGSDPATANGSPWVGIWGMNVQ